MYPTVLGIKPKALHMLAKHFRTELHLQHLDFGNMVFYIAQAGLQLMILLPAS
jgi:hypothetical protein